jgi:hypothetical protein
MNSQNAAVAGLSTWVVPAAAGKVSALPAAPFGLLPLFDMGAPVGHIHYLPPTPGCISPCAP